MGHSVCRALQERQAMHPALWDALPAVREGLATCLELNPAQSAHPSAFVPGGSEEPSPASGSPYTPCDHKPHLLGVQNILETAS